MATTAQKTRQTARTGRKATTTAPTTCGVCSLVLRINGERYQVRPVEAQEFGARRAFRLRKLADGTLYDVAELVTGAECDCPDFTFRRDGIDPAGCKHVRAMRAVGILGR